MLANQNIYLRGNENMDGNLKALLKLRRNYIPEMKYSLSATDETFTQNKIISLNVNKTIACDF